MSNGIGEPKTTHTLRHLCLYHKHSNPHLRLTQTSQEHSHGLFVLTSQRLLIRKQSWAFRTNEIKLDELNKQTRP